MSYETPALKLRKGIRQAASSHQTSLFAFTPQQSPRQTDTCLRYYAISQACIFKRCDRRHAIAECSTMYACLFLDLPISVALRARIMVMVGCIRANRALFSRFIMVRLHPACGRGGGIFVSLGLESGTVAFRARSSRRIRRTARRASRTAVAVTAARAVAIVHCLFVYSAVGHYGRCSSNYMAGIFPI